ncbi:MAG: GNAT family N-acetyltransferase [Chloroflexi bacterium]|nr:GNAT family N-acetyltransferase [Chloroflexota bacterium]
MREAFAEYDGKLPQPSGALRETVEDVRRAMAEGGAALAFIGETGVGSARYLLEADALYVGRVAVLPGYRRRGIASALMAFMEQHAREMGLTRVHIGVRESLPSNLALYESLGYERVNVEPHDADRSWTMIKPLSGQ